jgi:hypothetical protein
MVNTKMTMIIILINVREIICLTLTRRKAWGRHAQKQHNGPLHTRDWEPVTITLQALSLVEKPEPVQVRFTLCLRDQRSMWLQDGCKVHMDIFMASNGSCCMVTWIIFKNHLLEVGLTQNRETMTLWMLTTVDLFYFIMHEDLHE